MVAQLIREPSLIRFGHINGTNNLSTGAVSYHSTMRSVLLLCSLSSVFLVGSALLPPIHQIPEWQATHPGYRGSIEMGDNYKDDPKLENRIIGGTEATRHQFPYQVGIIVHLISGINGWCGGSLVSAHFVLTAAHCVDV